MSIKQPDQMISTDSIYFSINILRHRDSTHQVGQIMMACKYIYVFFFFNIIEITQYCFTFRTNMLSDKLKQIREKSDLILSSSERTESPTIKRTWGQLEREIKLMNERIQPTQELHAKA